MSDSPITPSSTQPEVTPPTETPPTTDPKPSLVNQGGDPPKDPPKKGEPLKEGEKPQAAPPPLTVEDFKDYKGFDANDPFLQEYVGIMNKEMPAKERAQELLKLQERLLSSVSEKGTAALNKQTEDWIAETQAMPEFANGKLEPALGGIAKLVGRFGDEKTKEAFDLTNAGNNPHIVKFLHKIAVVLNEPGIDPITPRPNSPQGDFGSKIYDHPTSKSK